MRAIVMAGGRGTRLAPFTSVFPKPLMPVHNTPILEILLGQLRDCGFDRATLTLGYLPHLIRSYFGDGSRLGMAIDYSQEDSPLGTAGPLSLLPQIEEPVLVLNADLLCNLDFGDVYRRHQEEGSSLTVGLHRKEVRIDFGVLTTDPAGRVLSYMEKPTLNYDVSMGVYVVDPSVHAMVRQRPGQRLDFPELINQLLDRQAGVGSYHFSGYWLDIGRPEDYERACVEFKDVVATPAETATTRPTVAPAAKKNGLHIAEAV